MKLKHDQGWSMPADSPFYDLLPARYRHVKMQFVFFHAAPDAVDELLPEPLVADPDGLCLAGGIDIPDSHYGVFQESFLMLRCRFGSQSGFYCSHVFHNGPAGIAAGREIYGTPKVYAVVRQHRCGSETTTETWFRDQRILTIRSVTSESAMHEELPMTGAAWRLKIIPRADMPRPAIKQLVDCRSVTQQFVLHERTAGTGEVLLGAAGNLDLSRLTPLSYGRAYCQECSYYEGFGEIVYDYLNPGDQKVP